MNKMMCNDGLVNTCGFSMKILFEEKPDSESQHLNDTFHQQKGRPDPRPLGKGILHRENIWFCSIMEREKIRKEG